MYKLLTALCICISLYASAQSSTEKQRILYGICTKDSLLADPFGNWFSINYESYHPDPTLVSKLQQLSLKDFQVKAFFGSWCGDSKREVPRFIKLMDTLSFPAKNIQLIALGGADSLIKQSPTHEEAGLGIFRVPTFIIYRNGKEINRINEFPVYSLERDLLSIIQADAYQPNYRSFQTVLQWLNNGILKNENNSIRGLAEQLRKLVADEHELNSLAYLLLKQGYRKESLQLFRINYSLYPESSNIASSLGEGYYENEDYKKAVNILERALELNKDAKEIKPILEILYKAKAKS